MTGHGLRSALSTGWTLPVHYSIVAGYLQEVCPVRKPLRDESKTRAGRPDEETF